MRIQKRSCARQLPVNNLLFVVDFVYLRPRSGPSRRPSGYCPCRCSPSFPRAREPKKIPQTSCPRTLRLMESVRPYEAGPADVSSGPSVLPMPPPEAQAKKFLPFSMQLRLYAPTTRCVKRTKFVPLPEMDTSTSSFSMMAMPSRTFIGAVAFDGCTFAF